MKSLLQKFRFWATGKPAINSATYRLMRMNKKLGFKTNS
jgi:hypothetical protein